MDGRIHAKRHPPLDANRTSLSLRVPTHELRRIGIRRVLLDVVGRDGLERDAQLLEDGAALRARRREDQPVFRATHRSSDGHLLAHSAVAPS